GIEYDLHIYLPFTSGGSAVQILVYGGEEAVHRVAQRRIVQLRGRGGAVAAAAELFHYHLRVHIAYRAGGDVRPVLRRAADEGGFHARDVQQLVCRLGDDDAVLRRLRHCDGDVAAVELRALEYLVSCDGVLHVVLQQLFDLRRVRARAAQEGGGVKGALARADGEVF